MGVIVREAFCPRGGGRRPPAAAPYLVRALSSLRLAAFVCSTTMYAGER